jgi:uncharacterized protein (DUF58 family)
MRINIAATLVYLILLYLVNLARVAIGGFFVYVHYLIIALPIISTIHLILTAVFLRYLQDFSSFHSVRGDEVSYRLRISMEFPVFSANVGISFKHINPHMQRIMEGRTVTVSPSRRIELDYNIPCPYIGVYTIGLEQLTVSDVIGWITLPLSVFYYTMYVYPRILDAGDFELHALTDLSKAGSRLGTSVDYSYFERLDEYRQGMDVRLMAWKRFAAQGVPTLRVYNRVSDPGVTIYLETRREGVSDRAALEREDFSLEILVSVAAELVGRGVPAGIRAAGLPPMTLRTADDVRELVNASLSIEFSADADVIDLFHSDGSRGRAPGSIVFITSEIGPELVRVFLRPPGGMNTIEAIVNETGASEESRQVNRRRIVPLGNAGSLIRFVDGADLEGGRIRWR